MEAAASSPGPAEYVSITGTGGYDKLQLVSNALGAIGANITVGSRACPHQSATARTPWSQPAPDAEPVVVVEVHYAGVNYADVCIRWGLYDSAIKVWLLACSPPLLSYHLTFVYLSNMYIFP